MSNTVSIDEMADAVVEGLSEYADLASDEVKKCVRKTSRDVRKEIQSGAPVRTGAYRDSWAVKKQKETSQSLELVIHSKNRYQLAHLLENGHAKRGGGRVPGKPHIAPAEEHGVKQLETEIERRLRK